MRENEKMETKQRLLSLEEYGFEEDNGQIKAKKKGGLKAEDLGEVGEICDAAILKAGEFEWEGEKKVTLELNIADLGEAEADRIKNLSLNKTNLGRLLAAFGRDLAKWENQIIELRVETTIFQGKSVSCIRVYAKKRK